MMDDVATGSGGVGWTARDIEARADWRHALSPEACVEARALGRGEVSAAPFLAAMMRETSHQLEHGPGMRLLSELPIEDQRLDESRDMVLALGRLLGTPRPQTVSGDLVNSIVDRGEHIADGSRGSRTNEPLKWHTDAVDVSGLLCLRAAPSGGVNRVASSMAIAEVLRARAPELAAVLEEPFPFAYRAHHSRQGGYEVPIFSTVEGRFVGYYFNTLLHDAWSMGPPPPPARVEAVALLEQIATELSIEVRLEPGQLLLLNSFTTLHMRERYEDSPGPDKRHLLRIGLSVPTSRRLPQSFAARFGDVGAGALRGGI